MRSKPLYSWDEIKRKQNLVEHKIDFAAADHFDWDTAFITVDDREDYGELRELACGFIGQRLHVLAYTHRSGKVRIISLRKADRKDVGRNVEANKQG